MAASPIRIAILEADNIIGKARAKYGSYGGVFTSLLHNAADASDLPRERLQITGWDVVNDDGAEEGKEEDMGGEWDWKRRKGYPEMRDVDAVLITGSRTCWTLAAFSFSPSFLAWGYGWLQIGKEGFWLEMVG